MWSQHPQHPGSPWGIGENVSTLQGWQGTAWSPWKGTQTQPQPHSALPTTAFDGSNRKVVCTSSLASRVAMGHLGQQYFTPGMAGHCLVTLLGRPHSPHHERPRRCRHCTQRFELPLGDGVSFDDVHAIFNGLGRYGALAAVLLHTTESRELLGHLGRPHLPPYGAPPWRHSALPTLCTQQSFE